MKNARWRVPAQGASNDFWRDVVSGTRNIPDGTPDDVTVGIVHNGPLHFGNDALTGVQGSRHEGIASYVGNGTFSSQKISTLIPANSTTMPTIKLYGYKYGTSDIIDISIALYNYNSPLNTIINAVWQSRGTAKPTSIRAGYESGLLVLEINWGSGQYFCRYDVSSYCDGPNTAQQSEWFQGWTVTNATILGTAIGVVTIVEKGACSAPMTRSALVSLRDSSGLSKDCDYVVTDHVQGRLVAGTQIHLQAVSANELSENVSVNTTYDNEAWAGIYDIDRALVLELTDNRGNVAKGINGFEVSNFDWGNISYTNVVVDNATLTVNIGNTAPKSNINVTMGATLNLTNFTGTINNFDVDRIATANFTGANGSWRLARVGEGSLLNCANYLGGGDNYYFEVLGASNLNFSGRTSQVVLQSCKLHGFNITAQNVTTGVLNITGCGALLNSTINQSVGAGATTITRVQMDGSSTLSNASAAGGIVNISNTRISSGGQAIKINAGTLALTQCEIIQGAAVSHNGTGTLSMTGTEVATVAQVGTDAGTTINPTFNYCKIEGSSALRCLGAVVTGTFTVSYTRLAGSSFIYKRAAQTGNVSVTRAEILGSSGLDFSSGNRRYTITRMDMNGVARANFTGTGAVTDSINEMFMTTRSVLNISCSGAANTINYNQISGLTGGMTLSGTTGAQNINRCKMDDGSIVLNNCTVNMGLALCSARDNGRINIQNMTVAKNIQYCDVSQLAQLNISAASGGGTVRAKVFGEAQFNQTGTAGQAVEIVVMGGILSQNGGTLSQITKGGGGTLTTGNFTHSNVSFISGFSQTMTAANTNRGRDFANNTII